MLQRQFLIRSRLGLHAHPVIALIRLSSQYDVSMRLVHEGQSILLNDMIGLLSAQISYGDSVTVYCDGRDEYPAMQAITQLFDSNFGEEV